MKIDESKYPMTYKEYEKRVINLFLQTYPEDKQEIMADRIDDLLNNEDPYFIRFLYNQDCKYYDSNASNAKTIFDDEAIASTPVHNLELWIGGEL